MFRRTNALHVARAIAALLIAAAAPASAQTLMPALDGTMQPIGTGELARVLEFTGIEAAPESVWRCHGAHLERVFAANEEARVAFADLALDGTRFESPESVRRAISAVRRAAAKQDEALEAMLGCLASGLSEIEQPKIDRLRAELRARMWMQRGLRYGPLYAHGTIDAVDISRHLDETPIDEGRREAVRAVVLAAAPTRERTGRALFDTGLANRMRMAELVAEIGVVGMTGSEADMPIMEATGRRLRAARERGEEVTGRLDVWTELSSLGSCAPEAARDAMTVQRDAVGAVAAVVDSGTAKRLRRMFRHRSLRLDEGAYDARWAMPRPPIPSVTWTARRVLSQPELRGERRTQALRILAEWADAEDRIAERMADEMIESLSRPNGMRGIMSRTAVGSVAIAELDEAAAPFERKLADLLEMPWIADAAIEAPPVPGADSFPEFSRDEMHLTGALHRDVPPHARADVMVRHEWHALRPADDLDADEWARVLALAPEARPLLDAVVAAHRAAWDARVSALLAAAAEPRPRGQRRLVEGSVQWEEPQDLSEWRARVRRAIEALREPMAALERELLDDLRSLVPPDEAWRVDAIAFMRAADRVLSVAQAAIDTRLLGSGEEVLGGRRIDPVRVLLRSGLRDDRMQAALGAAVPHLAPLAALAEEEKRFMDVLVGEQFGILGRPPMKPPVDPCFELNQLLAMHARWRTLERAALDAAGDALDALEPADRRRVQRIADALRFPIALGAIETTSRIAAELRAAAIEDPDVERGMKSIERIDAAEAALLESVEHHAASAVAVCREPPPVRAESNEALSNLCRSRVSRMSAGMVATHAESVRFAWYMANVLPREVTRRSPAFLRIADLYRVTPPQRTLGGHTIDPP